jgi:hypothetical protein
MQLSPVARRHRRLTSSCRSFASSELGVAVAPDDLRRTFAKLAYRGRAPLEQIQLFARARVDSDNCHRET